MIKHIKDLKVAFIKRSYQSKILDHHFDCRSKNTVIQKPSTQGNLPLVVTFNKTLPNIKNVIDKHWDILSINENLRKVFDKRPFISYRRHLHQLIGGNRILKNKVYAKTPSNQNNQDIAHHASQDWTIFVVSKWSKLKHSKVTEQNRSFKYFTILHAKVKD